MKLWKSASEWLMDTKGHPLDDLKARRSFLKKVDLRLEPS